MIEWHALELTELPDELSPWSGALNASLWIVGSITNGFLAPAAFNGVFGTSILKVDVLLVVIGTVSGFVAFVSVLAAIPNVGSAIANRKIDRGT